MKQLLTLSSLLLICNMTNAQRFSTDMIKEATIDTIVTSSTVPTNTQTASGAPITYSVTTNATDANCVTPFGGYVNLEDFGVFSQSTIIGDDVNFTTFGGQAIRFYGNEFVGLGFTTNGTVQFGGTFDPDSTNVGIPNAAVPNNMIAVFQNDMEVFHDAGLNHGISLATAGPTVSIIEYDDIQPKGGGAIIGDMQVIITGTVSNQPNTPEIVIAFDNIGTLPASATIGTEDSDGLLGTEFLFGDPSTTIQSGLIVCFDTMGDLPVQLMNFSVE